MTPRVEGASVFLTRGAELDLAAIYDYVARADGKEAAERLLQRLLVASGKLSKMPERGSYPAELLAVGIREFRQIVVSPHRVIYRVQDEKVFIVLIADSRRDMQSLLTERLMRRD